MFKVVFLWAILRGIIDWLTGREFWKSELIRLAPRVIATKAGNVTLYPVVSRSDAHTITTTLSAPIRRRV